MTLRDQNSNVDLVGTQQDLRELITNARYTLPTPHRESPSQQHPPPRLFPSLHFKNVIIFLLIHLLSALPI